MYLNTASISQARSDEVALKPRDEDFAVDISLLDEFEVFFAFNATRALSHFLSFFSTRMEFSISMDSWIHPVIEDEVLSLPAPTLLDCSCSISTLMHWRNGAIKSFDDLVFDECDLEIVDAVQAFGNMSLQEVESLLSDRKGKRVILGGLHKWIGSEIPLGFLLIPRSMIEDHNGLALHLARADYLGNSLVPRRISSFPDTFSSVLSGYLSSYWKLAFFDNPETSEAHRMKIQSSYVQMLAVLQSTTQLRIAKEYADHRAFCLLEGDVSELTRVSSILRSQDAAFTFYGDSEAKGVSSGIRLSAPLGPRAEREIEQLFKALS